ncbi:MAG: YqjF family protein [Halobacteriaceae archaeon]
MGWRHVLFADWAVDPAVVRPHVPDALTLDTFDGEAHLSVVPFTNAFVRPRALPAGLGFALPELNLRTYVSHGDAAGVYFFTLDADGLLGVAGARLLHHLPYHLAAMELAVRHGDGRAGDEPLAPEALDPETAAAHGASTWGDVDALTRARESGERPSSAGGTGVGAPLVRFASRRRHPGARPAAFDATYGPVAEPTESEPGGLRWFLTERYRYYTETPGGELRYAAVRHDPWRLAEAAAVVRENGLFEACGFAEPPGEPTVLYSPGVDVVASASRRVEGASD